MTASLCSRRIERRAEAAGCEIHDIPDISEAMVFHCLGQPPRIYIPEDLPAPYHGYAVLAMFDRLTTHARPEAERRAVWAEIVLRACGSLAAPLADGLAAD